MIHWYVEGGVVERGLTVSRLACPAEAYVVREAVRQAVDLQL